MIVIRTAQGDPRKRGDATDRWLRRLLWAAFAFTLVACYSAQVAHVYKDAHGARQCERCQAELHLASQPEPVQFASLVTPLPQPVTVFSYQLTLYLKDPHGIRPRGRAPPSTPS